MVKISKILSLAEYAGKSSEISMSKAVTSLRSKAVSFCGAEASASNAVSSAVNKLPVSAKFHSYPQELQSRLIALRTQVAAHAKTEYISGYLDNLMKFNSRHEYISRLIQSPAELCRYCAEKLKLNKLMDNATYNDWETKEVILENLTMMKLFNPKSYKALCESKGFNEILKGRLNISYLKDIQPQSKIDEDFFYKLFDTIEKETGKTLAEIKGLDREAAINFIKANDDEICRNPQLLDDFLATLKESKNPELAGTILRTLKADSVKSPDMIPKLIQSADEAPELTLKVLQMKYLNPYNLKYILTTFKDNPKVMSEEMLDYFIKFQQKHSDICMPASINGAVSFLRAGGEEKMLKELMEKTASLKDKPFAVHDVLYGLNENTIDYFKYRMSLGKFNEETVAKLRMMQDSEMFRDSANWSLADKVYEETYLPVHKLFAGKTDLTCAQSCAAEILAEKRINSPEIYKKIEDSGVVELIKAQKIHPRILMGLREGYDLTPEVYADLKMLMNKESLIKKFDNFDKILSKTAEGDVVSVKGQMFINNRGRLERWNMSEEKFNELFPLVDRFTAQQGVCDCYLITALDNLYRNPKSRAYYYKMFEQSGDDILVTIPAYKDYKGTIRFPKGEIKTSPNGVDGSKHVQMLEQTYARTALRTGNTIPVGQNPLTTEDLNFLVERNNAGHVTDVMREILLYNNDIRKNVLGRKIFTYQVAGPDDIANVQKNIFGKYGSNPRFLFNIAMLKPGEKAGHALEVRAYDPVTKNLTIVDPNFNGLQYEKTIDEIKDELFRVWTTVLPVG